MTKDLEALPLVQRIAAVVEDAHSSLQEFHDAMDEERAFCWDLEQYWHDTGNTRDRNRVQPRDQSPFRLTRFKAAEMARVPLYFTARGTDMNTDPKTAKWARWALQYDTEDPVKRFTLRCRETMWAGLSSRVGCMKISWNPDLGIFGDVVIDQVDAKNIGWAQPFRDPHHPMCPWFYEMVRIEPKVLERMTGWKNTKDVQPDAGTPGGSGSQSNTNASGQTDFGATAKAQERERQHQKFVTVVFFWERFGPMVKKQTYRVLSEQERYMVIAAGEQANQKVAVDYGEDPMPEIDITDDGVPIKRIDAILEQEEARAYPSGRLTICAPWSGEGVVFYTGPWPQPMRTFPYLVWQAYANPYRQIGTSDVDLNWTMTLVKNATVRRWYEQLRESRGIMMIPKTGLKDLNDEPFRYTDANGFVAMYETAMPQHAVRWVEGPQPSQQLQAFIQWAENNLRAQEGSSDISTLGSAESLKGVPVGVMNQAVESGNTSVQDHILSWNLELELFLSVWHDIQRSRWTVARWVRYTGDQGRDAWMRMRGADIPTADIRITTKPGISAIDAQQLTSLQTLAQIAATNPKVAEVAARHMDIDPDDLADILAPALPPQPPGMPQPGRPPSMAGGPQPGPPYQMRPPQAGVPMPIGAG